MDIFYPFQFFADWLTYNIFSISRTSLLGKAVNFFVFDSIKILLLMMVVVFAVALLRTFIPPERIRLFLSGKKTFTGNTIASLFGIITPFCTCSAIPLFLGFVEAGVPLGVTFSFLVASPMINEVVLVLLLGSFGLKVALIYIVSGLIIATLSGFIIGKMKLENLVEESVLKYSSTTSFYGIKQGWKQRVEYACAYTLDILKKVWGYVLVGIGVGAWIHGYVPADLLARFAGGNNWYAVPLATLIGIPLYSNAAGVIPLVSVLTEKGVAMGTTLSFMMAVTGLSLPEFMILKKVMKIKLLLIFASVVGIGIIFTGYLFNVVL
jgi:hypothetical protein